MPPSRPHLAALALVAALGAAHYPAHAQAAPERCSADPGHEALHAWVGDWQVIDEAGATVGTSTVRSVVEGCAFEEVRRRGDGSEELAVTFFDRATASWLQRWISSLGHTGLFELAFEQRGVAIAGPAHNAASGETLVRAFVAARPAGGFEEHLELSVDGGASYAAASVTLYLPQSQQASPAQSPAPAEQVAASAPPHPVKPEGAADDSAEPAGNVTLRSKRKAEALTPETAMESPMTLEFELGPLPDLPPGSAWRTTELAPYAADRVSITRVTAQSRERKGKTEVELVINLRTRAGHSKVDLDVTLLSDETSVASDRLEGVALGKLIGAHDPQDGLAQTVRLALDGATFAALFADGKRPSVRLTVTVR